MPQGASQAKIYGTFNGTSVPVAVTAGGLLEISSTATLAVKGFQQITGLSSATTLTIPSGATLALVQADVVDVRWRDDGTAPTASIGMLLPANSGPQTFTVPSLSVVEFIQTASGSILNVSYYG